MKTVKLAAPASHEQAAAVLAVQETHAQRAASDEVEWILDNGAQASVTSDLSLFTELHHDTVSELKFGNGCVERAQVGTVGMVVTNAHTGQKGERLLEEVSYSKNAPYNLLSQTYMQFKCGFKVSLSDDQLITWLTKGKLKLRFDYDRGHYRMRAPRLSKVVLGVTASQVENPMALLHNRLGHASMDSIKAMAAQKYNFGIKFQQQSFAPYECVPCIESKTKRMSYSRGPTRISKKLQKLCVDLCSVGVEAVSKANQFLLVVDEATRFKWGFLLTTKAEATAEIKTLLLRLAAKHPKLKTQVLFSDGGGEFLNAEPQTFCGGRGIELRSSNPYSPQENSIVERSNQTVMRQVRSMLNATQLPPSLWGEAFLHAIETLNYTTTSALKNNMTPYETLHGQRPDLSKLRTWGCLVHMHIPDAARQRKEKLSSRTQLCLLLGYSSSTNGYKLINLRNGSVTTCRGGNMKAHEQFTVDSIYVENLLQNTFAYGVHELPANVPIVPIKSTMQSYVKLPGGAAAQRAAQLAQLAMVGEPAAPVGDNHEVSAVVPAAPVGGVPCDDDSAASVGDVTRRKRRRAPADDDNWEPAAEHQQAAAARSTASSRPKRTRQRSVRLKDYVVTSVLAVAVEDVPATSKRPDPRDGQTGKQPWKPKWIPSAPMGRGI